ncbi:hypothetical protein PoB_004046700 [Plakobranchus ocellatus]|uniref:Uncharacterized protein n=1 Tax=Plakobranchus ocellatus TaxID=259542 RepID=A0AAV4B432_9GAST|nr:hypothetical protein PoB_004046700 [Plakobranchus ocellatus]
MGRCTSSYWEDLGKKIPSIADTDNDDNHLDNGSNDDNIDEDDDNDDIGVVVDEASPQQGDLRLSGPPSGQGAGSGARTRDRRVPADLRADSQATVLPTPPAYYSEVRGSNPSPSKVKLSLILLVDLDLLRLGESKGSEESNG